MWGRWYGEMGKGEEFSNVGKLGKSNYFVPSVSFSDVQNYFGVQNCTE